MDGLVVRAHADIALRAPQMAGTVNARLGPDQLADVHEVVGEEVLDQKA